MVTLLVIVVGVVLGMWLGAFVFFTVREVLGLLEDGFDDALDAQRPPRERPMYRPDAPR